MNRGMNTLEGLLAGIVADPLEETRWLVLADWLEEFDDPRRAELLRLHRKMLATCCEPSRYLERADWQARMVALIAEGVRPCLPQETVTLPGGVGMNFSFIPPGSFLMGSNHPRAAACDKPAIGCRRLLAEPDHSTTRPEHLVNLLDAGPLSHEDYLRGGFPAWTCQGGVERPVGVTLAARSLSPIDRQGFCME